MRPKSAEQAEGLAVHLQADLFLEGPEVPTLPFPISPESSRKKLFQRGYL